jgi:hypothetical protein
MAVFADCQRRLSELSDLILRILRVANNLFVAFWHSEKNARKPYRCDF